MRVHPPIAESDISEIPDNSELEVQGVAVSVDSVH